jgi:hypothetical protein
MRREFFQEYDEDVANLDEDEEEAYEEDGVDGEGEL